MKKQNLILTTKAGHQFRIHANEVPNNTEGKDIAERMNRKYAGTDLEIIDTMEVDDADIHGDTFIILPDDFGFTEAEEVTDEEPQANTWALEQQFNDLKAKHPDALLLCRSNDYYESYKEDAHTLYKILGEVAPEHRNEQGVITSRFPHHALDTYLPKLIRTGVRVAICDLLEEPKPKKVLKKK